MSLRGVIPLPQACTLFLRDRSNIPKDGPSRDRKAWEESGSVPPPPRVPIYDEWTRWEGGGVTDWPWLTLSVPRMHLDAVE